MKQSKSFAVGDRVKVHRGGRAPFKGKVEAVTGVTSIQIIEDGFYSVHDDSPFHPRQLVRLKVKPKAKSWCTRSHPHDGQCNKKEPRRVWTTEDGITELKKCRMALFWDHEPVLPKQVQFVECLLGHALISKGKLAEAWHIVMKNYAGVSKPAESRAFDNFARELGLGDA